MTKNQANVYKVIDEWWKQYGFAPSIDEVMELAELTGRGHTHRIMKQLCEAGHCKRIPNRARSIRPSYLRIRDID